MQLSLSEKLPLYPSNHRFGHFAANKLDMGKCENQNRNIAKWVPNVIVFALDANTTVPGFLQWKSMQNAERGMSRRELECA